MRERERERGANFPLGEKLRCPKARLECVEVLVLQS